jgi:predicted transglutaminase-like cysteine proteinase
MTARLTRALLAAACLAFAGPAFAQALINSEPYGANPGRLRAAVARTVPATAPVSPDVFGTVALGAGVTFYDSRFRRVAAADRDHPAVLQIAAGLRGLGSAAQLAQVQSDVKARVRWAHDLDTVRVADLWANAGETLERGRGDSEDIAIVKMQALKAAGWDPRDLYISIGRQRTGPGPRAGAHIVLLARTPAGFMVLDDMAALPLTPQQHGRFTPVLTVGEGKSWIHGRRAQSVAARISAR